MYELRKKSRRLLSGLLLYIKVRYLIYLGLFAAELLMMKPVLQETLCDWYE